MNIPNIVIYHPREGEPTPAVVMSSDGPGRFGLLVIVGNEASMERGVSRRTDTGFGWEPIEGHPEMAEAVEKATAAFAASVQRLHQRIDAVEVSQRH